MDFDPQNGHEQAGYRPGVVVSNDFFNTRANLTLVCPITNTNRSFPLHVPLDTRTTTTGVIQCEQIKAVDLASRRHRFVERLPDDLLDETISILFAEIER